MKSVFLKIVLLLVVVYLSSAADDAAMQKKRIDGKKYTGKSYSEKTISIAKHQKKSILKKQHIISTPKIDALLHSVIPQVQQPEKIFAADTSKSFMQSNFFAIVVSLLLAGCFTAVGFYVMKNKLTPVPAPQNEQLRLNGKQINAAVSHTLKPNNAMQEAAEKNFTEENESLALTERFQASQEHFELEKLLNSDPKTAKWKLLNLSQKSSVKKQIAMAKKLDIGVGELVLHQRIKTMERNGKKENA